MKKEHIGTLTVSLLPMLMAVHLFTPALLVQERRRLLQRVTHLEVNLAQLQRIHIQVRCLEGHQYCVPSNSLQCKFVPACAYCTLLTV